MTAFLSVVMPPAELLTAELSVDGQPQPITGAELSLTIECVDDESDPQHWRPVEHPAVGLVLLLVITDDDWYRVTVPAAAVGLSLGSQNEPKAVAVHTPNAVRHHPMLSATIGPNTFARTPADTIQGELAGVLANGAAFECRFSGVPLGGEVSVVHPQGRGEAEAWLTCLWPGVHRDGPLDIHESSHDLGSGEVFYLRWYLPRIAEAANARIAAELAERRQREAAAEAQELAALRARPVPEPTAEAPLVAACGGHAVAGARLSVVVAGRGESGPAGFGDAEPSSHRLSLELNIDVNAPSGEDGVLAPVFRVDTRQPPFSLPIQGRWQTHTEGEIESFIGNDAPELEAHRFAWRFIGPAEVEIDWTAQYDDWQTRQREQFHYRGRARVESIWLEAPDEAALPAAARAAFDAETLAGVSLGPAELCQRHAGDIWLAPVTIELLRSD